MTAQRHPFQTTFRIQGHEYNQRGFVASIESLLRHSTWDGECYMWNAAKPGSYGVMRDPQNSARFVGPHRIMYQLAHKTQLGRGDLVCHSCDKPGCVTPDHLWAGTHSENMRDMARKGRASGSRPRGRS